MKHFHLLGASNFRSLLLCFSHSMNRHQQGGGQYSNAPPPGNYNQGSYRPPHSGGGGGGGQMPSFPRKDLTLPPSQPQASGKHALVHSISHLLKYSVVEIQASCCSQMSTCRPVSIVNQFRKLCVVVVVVVSSLTCCYIQPSLS